MNYVGEQDFHKMYSADQGYYCQMGPPPPMAQPATPLPHDQYQPQDHYPQEQYSPVPDYTQNHYQPMTQQMSPHLTPPPGSNSLTILPPQSPYSSMPSTPMTPATFSPRSDSMSSPNNFTQQRSPQLPDSTNGLMEANGHGAGNGGLGHGSGSKGKGYRGTGTPYIPSYMDLTNGPEPCVVCSDAATGYHYRCMTCEGCKGFFRRTIQKNLQYHCKWNNSCIIDKTTRNQCQYCRFQKCVNVGMATDLVLNERQRVAKRKLIEDNRERRREEQKVVKVKHESCSHDDGMTEDDMRLIEDISSAYEHTSVKVTNTYTLPERTQLGVNGQQTDPDVWQQLAEVMTPSIVKVVEFAKRVPGFLQLNVDDQILLLKCCCMEVMCLRAACRYNPDNHTLTLQNGLVLTKSQLGAGGGLGMLMEPIFDFAIGLAKLKLDQTEIALLAAVLLMQSDRTGLRNPEPVEGIQDTILGAYKRYIAENRPSQPVHWAKVLMKVTDLRTISTRHAERVLCIKLDSPGELPPLFLEMFDEGCHPGLAGRPPFPPNLTPSNREAFSEKSSSLCNPFTPLSLTSVTSSSLLQAKHEHSEQSIDTQALHDLPEETAYHNTVNKQASIHNVVTQTPNPYVNKKQTMSQTNSRPASPISRVSPTVSISMKEVPKKENFLPSVSPNSNPNVSKPATMTSTEPVQLNALPPQILKPSPIAISAIITPTPRHSVTHTPTLTTHIQTKPITYAPPLPSIAQTHTVSSGAQMSKPTSILEAIITQSAKSASVLSSRKEVTSANISPSSSSKKSPGGSSSQTGSYPQGYLSHTMPQSIAYQISKTRLGAR